MNVLRAMLAALLHGAAAAQRSLLSHFRSDYRRCVERHGPGWAAGLEMRRACTHLLRATLSLLPSSRDASLSADAGTLARQHTDTRQLLLKLSSVTLDRFARAINIVAGHGSSAAVEELLLEAQTNCSMVLDRLFEDLQALHSVPSVRTDVRTQMQALAGIRLLDDPVRKHSCMFFHDDINLTG